MSWQDVRPLRARRWDNTYLVDAVYWSRRSHDPETQCGCVIVNPMDNTPISHGYNGFVVKPNDSVSLSEFILKLAENRSLRTSMGLNSRNRAVNEFSIERFVSLHENLYRASLLPSS